MKFQHRFLFAFILAGICKCVVVAQSNEGYILLKKENQISIYDKAGTLLSKFDYNGDMKKIVLSEGEHYLAAATSQSVYVWTECSPNSITDTYTSRFPSL